MKIINISHNFFYMNVCIEYKWKNKNKLKEIVIKNRVRYYFHDSINGAKINFSNILLNKKITLK